MNFTEGADWSETAAGTNALGTALEVSRPVQIFAGEHYNTVVHPWSCSAVPVRDPDSGIVLGVVDRTGGANIASLVAETIGPAGHLLWNKAELILDVAPGEPEGFSLGPGCGMHFVVRSEACAVPDKLP